MSMEQSAIGNQQPPGAIVILPKEGSARCSQCRPANALWTLDAGHDSNPHLTADDWLLTAKEIPWAA